MVRGRVRALVARDRDTQLTRGAPVRVARQHADGDLGGAGRAGRTSALALITVETRAARSSAASSAAGPVSPSTPSTPIEQCSACGNSREKSALHAVASPGAGGPGTRMKLPHQKLGFAGVRTTRWSPWSVTLEPERSRTIRSVR